jgi:hypothetical protein
MTEPEIDINEEVRATKERVADAMALYLNAMNTYDRDGDPIETKLKVTYEILRDPETKRTQKIREGADEGLVEIRDFIRESSQLAFMIATLQASMHQASGSIQMETWKAAVSPFVSIPVVDSGAELQFLDSLKKNMDKVMLKFNFLATRWVLIGYQTEWVLRAAADTYSARLSILNQFEGNRSLDGPSALVGAAMSAAATEAKLTILQGAISAMAIGLGIAFPVALVALPLINIGIEARKAMVEVDRRYERGDTDEALDLVSHLHRENEVTNNVIVLVEQLTTGLALPLTKTS